MSVRHVSILILFVSFVIVGYWYIKTDESYARSAERGLTWLLSYPSVYNNEGVFWALHHINTTYCTSPELGTYIEERYGKETKTPASSYYESFRTATTTIVAPPLDTLPPYDKWLVSALSCSAEILLPHIVQSLESTTNTGYDLTHQYIALTYLERLSCENALTVELASLRDRIAERMKEEDETTHHVFSDVSAERSALLLWGGHGRFVSKEWIDTIVANQDVSGGWKDAKTDTAPNPHTTVLAVWSLTQYTNQCPLGTLYSTSL